MSKLMYKLLTFCFEKALYGVESLGKSFLITLLVGNEKSFVFESELMRLYSTDLIGV
jgi:hypothetical protein